MLAYFNALLILVLLFAGGVVSRNGCRQCTGRRFLRFDNFLTVEQATAAFKASIGQCATGNEFETLVIDQLDCQQPCLRWSKMPCECGPPVCLQYTGIKTCKAWLFYVKAWRYCGNGSVVDFDKGRQCFGGQCVSHDKYALSCNQSVDCNGTCDCKQCGCA